MPLIGCLDLLLADIEQSSARFLSSSDEKLRVWLEDYPGDKLEAICVFCKNWLENDVLVGYRDIDLKEVDLDSWFEDREIQEFIEKLENKSNKKSIRTKIANQPRVEPKESSTKLNEDSEIFSSDFVEGKLPLPGGIRKEEQSTEENFQKEEIILKKSIDFYKYFIEKFTELKFTFGEAIARNQMLDKSPYLNYLYVFLILFTFGLGLGILRNNFKKPLQYKETIVKPSVINGNNSFPKRNTIKIESNKISEKSKVDAKGKNKSISLAVNAVKNPSPSLEQIQSLIDAWLLNKSQFLEGKTELNLSKIVRKILNSL